jgi:hypothetical protein
MSSTNLANLTPLIFTIRNQKVILDEDLAAIYGVPTKAFNQTIKRNLARFPASFMFQLTAEEAEAMRSQNVTASPKRNLRFLPYAFTEHGALMAATVLNSPKAVSMSVYLINAFIRLREELSTSTILEKRLAVIERTLVQHDSALKDLFRAIKPLLLPPPDPPKKKIGFHPR